MSESLQIHLPTKLRQFVKEQIESNGLYASEEEFIRDLIRKEYLRSRQVAAKIVSMKENGDTKTKSQSSQKTVKKEIDFDLDEIISVTKNELS